MNLLEHKLTGIVGGEGKRGAIQVAKVMAAQIAACNCYTDVKMVFVYDGANSEDAGQWEFRNGFLMYGLKIKKSVILHQVSWKPEKFSMRLPRYSVREWKMLLESMMIQEFQNPILSCSCQILH